MIVCIYWQLLPEGWNVLTFCLKCVLFEASPTKTKIIATNRQIKCTLWIQTSSLGFICFKPGFFCSFSGTLSASSLFWLTHYYQGTENLHWKNRKHPENSINNCIYLIWLNLVCAKINFTACMSTYQMQSKFFIMLRLA